MRRFLIVSMFIVAIGLIAIPYTVILRASNQKDEMIASLTEEVERFEEIEEQDVAEGGAETAPPTPPESDSEYRFPIDESDYIMYTSAYGYRVSPILNVERYHQGTDIAATNNAQVVSIADGTIIEHWPPPDGYYKGHPVYGGMVIIEHDNGWKSLYAHLSWTRVNTGDRVSSGTVIGRIGNTGQSRGSHLHIELIDHNGDNVNPELYFEPKVE